MFKLSIAVFFILATLLGQAQAQEWPGEAKQKIVDAGRKLSNAKTPADRVAALRDVQRIAKANPDSKGAQLLARMVADKATQEASPSEILGALSDYAKAGKVRDPDTLREFLVPYLATLSDMHENGTLYPKAIVELDEGLKKLDSIMKKAGLPELTKIVDDPFGDTIQTPKAVGLIAKIASFVKAKAALENWDKLDADARKKAIDDWISVLPTGLSPALYGPAYIVFRDQVVWNGEMFRASSQGLGLVTEAMETGKLDLKKYAKVEKRIKELRKGPWRTSTAIDAMKSLCKHVPVATAWCDDIFKVATDFVQGINCEAISCDCGNAGPGGLVGGGIVVQCKIQESNLISICKKEKKAVGKCSPGFSGPGATLK